MGKLRTDLKIEHRKAVKMFGQGKAVKEVAHTLQVPEYRVKKWKAGYKKLQNTNLKHRFISDFSSGQNSINKLARRYGVDWRKLLKWKHELYGKGSLKQKRMYQMHVAGLPSPSIAEFFKVPIPQVHTSIRQQRAKHAQNT